MLTMLGMIIGVWAVISLVAIGEGASHDAQEAIKALGRLSALLHTIVATAMLADLRELLERYLRKTRKSYARRFAVRNDANDSGED